MRYTVKCIITLDIEAESNVDAIEFAKEKISEEEFDFEYEVEPYYADDDEFEDEEE